VRCTKACFAQATGRLVAASRTFRLKSASRALAAGRKRAIAVKVPKKARRAAASALSHHRSVIARITILAATGSKKTLSVKLRRG
jgi:hypothetical protein